jgi:hypothetical protein
MPLISEAFFITAGYCLKEIQEEAPKPIDLLLRRTHYGSNRFSISHIDLILGGDAF